MKRQILNRLGPIVAAALFAAALLILHHQLRGYNYRDIVHSIRDTADSRIFLALLLTALSYALLTGYDALALRYIERPLPYPVAAMAAFVGYAFSNNGGFPLVTGGSVRYRIYSSWQLTAIDVGKIMLFGTTTFWLGFFTLGAVSFLADPLPLPDVITLPVKSTEPIGFLFLGIVTAYFVLCSVRRTPIRVGSWDLRLPSPRFALGQIVLASADLLAAAGVCYVLLPPETGISYAAFTGIFVVAILAGVVSQVPGGIGVFETIVMLLLQPYLSGPPILAALLAFRAIYYLTPLAVAAAVLGGNEVYTRRRLFGRVGKLIGPWVPLVAPQALALTVFIGGAILLFSGATPALHGRLAILRDFLPLPAIEVSHLVGSLAGMGLILLARGLQQRLDAAYYGASTLLVFGIAASLLKGLDYEEAIILTVMLAALLPCRPFFFRRASILRPSLSPAWTGATLLVLLMTFWLLAFAYKNVEYRNELWWQFAIHGHAARSLRAAVGAGSLLSFFMLARLFAPAPPEPAFPGPSQLEKVRAVLETTPETPAHLALTGDKLLLFSDDEHSFIMYGVYGRSWVALGDPVGAERDKRELVWRFREACDRYSAWPVFYEVSDRFIPLYLDIGLTLLKLGEEARVPLEHFTLEGAAFKELRYAMRRIEREGGNFEVVPPEAVPPLLPELREVSESWLHARGLREKGFSLGYFKEDYIAQCPLAIIRVDGRIDAFANLWLGGGREELSLDLMRHRPDALPGMMDFLFTRLMLWGREEQYAWFNLGMAPLSGLESSSLAPLWHRVGALVFRHGEHFYNFRGLRQYKEKFNPVWRPRYLATPGGLVVPRVLANVTALISGPTRPSEGEKNEERRTRKKRSFRVPRSSSHKNPTTS
jgi:phosphatidylglycerol lysyltransferase